MKGRRWQSTPPFGTLIDPTHSLVSQMVAIYPFNEIFSIPINNINRITAISSVVSPIGTSLGPALYFNNLSSNSSSSAYIIVSNDGSLNLQPPFTLSICASINTTYTVQTLLSTGNKGGVYAITQGLVFYVNNTALSLIVGNGSGNTGPTSPPGVVINKKFQVYTVTFDTKNNINLYSGSNLVQSYVLPGKYVANPQNNISIGSMYLSGSYGAYSQRIQDGSIKWLGAWNRIINTKELQIISSNNGIYNIYKPRFSYPLFAKNKNYSFSINVPFSINGDITTIAGRLIKTNQIFDSGLDANLQAVRSSASFLGLEAIVNETPLMGLKTPLNSTLTADAVIEAPFYRKVSSAVIEPDITTDSNAVLIRGCTPSLSLDSSIDINAQANRLLQAGIFIDSSFDVAGLFDGGNSVVIISSVNFTADVADTLTFTTYVNNQLLVSVV